MLLGTLDASVPTVLIVLVGLIVLTELTVFIVAIRLTGITGVAVLSSAVAVVDPNSRMSPWALR